LSPTSSLNVEVSHPPTMVLWLHCPSLDGHFAAVFTNGKRPSNESPCILEPSSNGPSKQMPSTLISTKALDLSVITNDLSDKVPVTPQVRDTGHGQFSHVHCEPGSLQPCSPHPFPPVQGREAVKGILWVLVGGVQAKRLCRRACSLVLDTKVCID
jgi:hypothetical protein